MNFIFSLLFLCSALFSLAQTPKTEGLIVLAPRANILYNHFKNPILINQSFDSLSYSHGNISIENSTIFIQPNRLGRSILYMYLNEEKTRYFFNVKDIDIKPRVHIPSTSQGRWGNLQDKTKIYTYWDVPFEVKTSITSFQVIIEKVDGEIVTVENKTGRFSKELISVFRLLEAGDVLRFEKVHCTASNGIQLFAADYRIEVK